VSSVVSAEGAAELNGGETKFIAKLIGGFGEFFESFAAVGFEKVELLAAMGEMGKCDAEEADFAFRIAMLTEKVEEDRKDVRVELRGFGESLGTGVGVETGVADGEGEGAGGEAGFAEAFAGLLGKVAEQRFHGGDVGRVFAEGVVVGDGLGLGVDEEFVGVTPAGLAIKRCAPLPEDLFKFFLRVGGELFYDFDAKRAEGAFGDFADAGDFADGERGEEAGFHAGCDPNKAARLALIRSNLGGETRGGESAGAWQAGLLRDGAQELVGSGERGTMQAFGAGEIQIGFVDGDHFDDGREFGENSGDAIAPFGIFFMMAVEENGVGTKSASRAEGHGGMDAVFAGFVTGSGDDAALVRAAADDNGLAAEVRAVEEFNGDEEGVHVHMEDGRVDGEFRVGESGVVLGAEASKIRHEDRVGQRR